MSVRPTPIDYQRIRDGIGRWAIETLRPAAPDVVAYWLDQTTDRPTRPYVALDLPGGSSPWGAEAPELRDAPTAVLVTVPTTPTVGHTYGLVVNGPIARATCTAGQSGTVVRDALVAATASLPGCSLATAETPRQIRVAPVGTLQMRLTTQHDDDLVLVRSMATTVGLGVTVEATASVVETWGTLVSTLAVEVITRNSTGQATAGELASTLLASLETPAARHQLRDYGATFWRRHDARPVRLPSLAGAEQERRERFELTTVMKSRLAVPDGSGGLRRVTVRGSVGGATINTTAEVSPT